MSEDEKMRVLFEALADELDSMSDEEVVEECLEGGRSPQEIAQHTRAVLQSAVRSFNQRVLTESRAERTGGRKMIAALRSILPLEPQQRRSMLATVFQNQPDARDAWTARWNDYEEMTDADIELALAELAQLGLIDTDRSE
jgi:hypothetical protein